jgi:hypothetical protein
VNQYELIRGIGAALAFGLIALMATAAHGEECGLLVADTGPRNRVFVAQEPIEAGALVTCTAGGIANATTADDQHQAQGFVICQTRKGELLRVFGPGDTNTALHGLAPGAPYRLAAEPGGITDALTWPKPGQLQQIIGTATATNALVFLPQAKLK